MFAAAPTSGKGHFSAAMVELTGLDLFPEFVSPAEESILLMEMAVPAARGARPARSSAMGTERHRVERYGRTDYAHAKVSGHIPAYIDDLCLKLRDLRIVRDLPNAVTVNEYRIGHGLSAHIDKPEGGQEICILGLVSDATMAFEFTGGTTELVPFPRRSLLRMRGAARWEWSHQLLPVAERRMSIVFRHVA